MKIKPLKFEERTYNLCASGVTQDYVISATKKGTQTVYWVIYKNFKTLEEAVKYANNHNYNELKRILDKAEELKKEWVEEVLCS